MKTCTKCKQEKSRATFSKNKRRKDGLHNWCKQCVSEQGKVYRIKNSDRVKALNRARVHSLKDSYVAKLLCQGTQTLRPRDIPQALIEAKRLHLLIKRKLKGEV